MRGLVLVHSILCLVGVGIALYSLHVESMMTNLPGYVPACDLSTWQMSCSKVFSSKYAKPLSHWGIVKSRSSFDLALPHLALMYFVPVLLFPFFRKFGLVRLVFRALSYASLAFNIYLAYILKFVLGEVCVVCVSNYLVNLGLWITVNRLASEPARQVTQVGKKRN